VIVLLVDSEIRGVSSFVKALSGKAPISGGRNMKLYRAGNSSDSDLELPLLRNRSLTLTQPAHQSFQSNLATLRIVILDRLNAASIPEHDDGRYAGSTVRLIQSYADQSGLESTAFHLR